MSGSDSWRLRLLFRTGAVDRQFCWFERRGDDLYWGTSRGETIEGAVAEIHEDGMGMTLSVPEGAETVENEPIKASFHASGRFHLKRAEGLIDAPRRWRLKEGVRAPYRVAALLSKHPVLYAPYPSERSLIRGRSSAFVLRVDEEQAAARHYFEFFVSPEGSFPPPPPILSLTSTGGEPEPEPRFFSLSERLILVMRQFVIAPASGLSAWHPELGVWIHGEYGSNVALEDPASPA